MGRSPCINAKDSALNRGSWTAQEDLILKEYITLDGDGHSWGSLPHKAGLKRCGKSCRLRWLNYLRPGIKRGNISTDEEELIIRLHRLLGNRWSLIAGRLPGRTDNEIKNYWNTRLRKKIAPEKDRLFKPHMESKPGLPATDLVFESTLVKTTAVRPAIDRKKHFGRGNSNHENLRSSDVGETVKASKSWCESLVEELMKEDYYENMDSTTSENVAKSGSPYMEINGQYFPPSIPNLIDWEIPHCQHSEGNEYNMSESLLYWKNLYSSEFDLLPTWCDFEEDFGMEKLCSSRGASER